jgi:hypothetical protein
MNWSKNNHSRKAEVPEAREAGTELGLRFDMEFVEDTGGTNFAFVMRGGYT